MKRTVLLIAVTLIALSACQNKQEQLIQRINDTKSQLSMIDIASDDALAYQIVDDYILYATNYPDDSLRTPQYLVEAADVSSQIGLIDSSLSYLYRVIYDYPSYDDLGLCYFMIGHILEQNERFDEATVAYNEYLSLFPDHYLAESTRKMLPYMGMPAEELLDLVLKEASKDSISKK